MQVSSILTRMILKALSDVCQENASTFSLALKRERSTASLQYHTVASLGHALLNYLSPVLCHLQHLAIFFGVASAASWYSSFKSNSLLSDDYLIRQNFEEFSYAGD